MRRSGTYIIGKTQNDERRTQNEEKCCILLSSFCILRSSFCVSSLGFRFDIEHFEDDEILHIDQADGAVVGVYYGEFVDAVLAEDGHGFAGESVGADSFWVGF